MQDAAKEDEVTRGIFSAALVARLRAVATSIQNRFGLDFLAVRTKVIAILTLAGVAMILLSAVFVLHIYQGQAKERAWSRAEAFSDILVHAVGNSRSQREVDLIVDAFGKTTRVGLVAIADAKGTVLSASQVDWRGLAMRRLIAPAVQKRVDAGQKAIVDAESGDVRFAEFARQIPLPFANETGTLFVRLNTTAAIDSLQAAAWSILVWLTAGIILSALTVSLVMQRIVIGPIEALRDFAINRGPWRYVVPMGPSDEISVVAQALTDSFNARSASEEHLADLAHTDGLTGLGNRSFFKSQLIYEIERAERSGHMIGVLVLNLDSFKDINDTLGHDAGDLLLQRIADILSGCQRKGDTIARFAADEFGIILSNISSTEEAADLASRLIRAVGVPFRLVGHDLQQTACVGVTLFPQDGRDPEVLLKNADLALSRAKQEGSGACVLYRHELHLRAIERNTIERDLRVALSRKQFVLYYQPKVDIRTGRVTGAEALIRWHHPERGLVPPDLFIPVAERCGFIADVTKWVLDEACRQNRAWQDMGLTKIGVAVNVSAVDLRRSDLTDTVANTLVTRGLSPQYLELEVTESMVMRDVDVVIGTLRRLRSLGVGIGIDDFGTGYSSLAYLKRFPVKRLKIDRSFVRDIADQGEGRIIPKVIIDLAHALGIEVLAEGIEDAEQLEILRMLGCDEGQGYFLGKPMPAANFEAFLRNTVDGIHPDATIRAITSSAPGEKVDDVAPLRGVTGSAA
ncbi:MAG: EAL domain-containing protein [Parvibaculum sp.]|uniref:putative bifunctional diguanylate cyclase/phosphodiesterase n=1 Tax=Parvibaculum sp. TaxID=2024848 RepID=UPI003C70FECD